MIAAFVRWVASKLNASGSSHLRVPRDRLSPGCAKLPPGRNDRALLAGPCLRIELLDLRPEEWTSVDGIVVKKTPDWRRARQHHVRLNAASELAATMAGPTYGASSTWAKPTAPTKPCGRVFALPHADGRGCADQLASSRRSKWGGASRAPSRTCRDQCEQELVPPPYRRHGPDQGGDQFPRSPPSRMESRWMGAAKRWSKAARLSVFRARQKAGACVRDTKSCALGGLYGNDTAGGWSWT